MMILKIASIALISVVAIVGSLVGIWFSLGNNLLTALFLLILTASVAIIIWTTKSVRVIKASQIGVLLRFGEIISINKPGIYFALKGIYSWLMYSQKQHALSYKGIKVITKEGKYGGPLLGDYSNLLVKIGEKKEKLSNTNSKQEKEKIKKELADLEKEATRLKPEYKEKADLYERAQIEVDLAIYFRWPSDDEGLKNSVHYGPTPGDPDNPKDMERIAEHFGDAIEGNMRSIGGAMTWGEVIENRDLVKKKIEDRLNEDSSPFSIAGIGDFYAVVSGITLPPELQKLLTKPQEERIRAKAAEEEMSTMQRKIGGSIGESAKMLEKDYEFSPEEARRVAVERHGDFVAGEKGQLVRVKFDGESNGGGGFSKSVAELGFMFELGKKMATKSSSSPSESEKKPSSSKSWITKKERDDALKKANL
jgi:regulator of protease activity HflC (stomatin/prohibitin superfamily)